MGSISLFMAPASALLCAGSLAMAVSAGLALAADGTIRFRGAVVAPTCSLDTRRIASPSPSPSSTTVTASPAMTHAGNLCSPFTSPRTHRAAPRLPLLLPRMSWHGLDGQPIPGEIDAVRSYLRSHPGILVMTYP